MWIDKNQGSNDDGKFGYVGLDADGLGGGFFFTWHSTLAETLASIEPDEVDRPKGRYSMTAVQRMVRAAWREERSRPGPYSLIPRQSWDPSACESRRYRQSEACPA